MISQKLREVEVRPLVVPNGDHGDEIMVTVYRHEVPPSGIILPEGSACHDGMLLKFQVVRLPDAVSEEEVGFRIGDWVRISVASGFQKPTLTELLDYKNLLMTSTRFIVAVETRPKNLTAEDEKNLAPEERFLS